MPDSRKDIPLSGKLMTAEPATIGVNYRSLINMRYTDTHPKGIGGMTKINSNVMDAAVPPYLKTRNAFHLLKSQPAESHVLVQAWNTGLTTAHILDNIAAIPATGEFEATDVFSDTAAAGRGYFSQAPDGQIIYANGIDTCIWGGSEVRCGAVISNTIALAAASDIPTSPKDYTVQANNTKTDSDNSFVVGGGYLTFLVGSPRPAKGAKIYVGTANTTANTLVVKESTAGSWTTLTVTADGTRAAGKTFAQTGTISWATTVASTKPKYIDGYYAYWYQFTVDACLATTSIYHITLDLPFQPIIDMWDGVYRELLRFYVTTTSQSDETIKVLRDDYDSATASSYADISGLVATTQFLEAGFGEKQTAVYVAVPPGYENTDAAAVAAQGTITMGGVAIANETFVIGAQTFTWKAARGGVGEVTIGASAAAACSNIVTAVGLDLATVTAALGAPDTVIITAATVGTAGNAIDFTENSTNMTMNDYGGGHLGGTTAGVDGTGVTSVDYWTGSAWATVGTVTDGTATGGVPLAKSGVISWNNTALSSEHLKQYANAVPLFYYKIKFSATLDASVRINYVSGITASKVISYYKFPVFAQGRVLLCGDMAGEKNKAICSAKFMPQVYNGTDTADIYFGDDGELTCGTELFSQFGASLFSLVLMFKDNETWMMAGQDIEQWGTNTFLLSSSIGCPAPLTLKTINLFSDPGVGINRCLAIWQGSNGIFMSDGRAPMPIHMDIKEYFDTSDSRCIKSSMVGDSISFIDYKRQEYHWLFASGTAATTLNKELVYDIARNKWFEIDRVVDLQCGIAVHDTDGNGYAYGFLDTGYMERLEYGLTFDGGSRVHTLHTGDMVINDSLGVTTQLKRIKTVQVAKTSTANSATVTHYGDCQTAGQTFTVPPLEAGKRIAINKMPRNYGDFTFHALKYEMTNNDDAVGWEPLAISLFYANAREE